MRKNIFVLSAILLLSVIAYSQPDTLWTRTYGGILSEGSQCCQQTSDGGYIITGNISEHDSLYAYWDFYLLKTDEMGNELWSQAIDMDELDIGKSVQQTSDGGYIIAGSTSSLQNFDVVLIKTDTIGNMEWGQRFGLENPFSYGNSCQQTSDGGYIVVGRTWSYHAGGSYDVWLIKTNDFGEIQWDHTFGGGNDDKGYCVSQTYDSGYVIVGRTDSYGADYSNVYLIKTDSLGREQWSQTYGGNDWDLGFSGQQTCDGGYIIAGRTSSYGAGGCDVYLIKTDTEGNELWSQTFGGVDYDDGQSVQQTYDGGYIIGGVTESYGAGGHDVYIVKADAEGNEQWSQTYGGSSSDDGYSVQQTFDGGYVIAGHTWSFGAGEQDAYLICLDAEEPPDISITLTPSNPPIQIPAGGGTFDFNIEVINSGVSTLAFDMWTMATLPNGNEYGPILYIENYELNAGQSASRDRMQYVPMHAPPGIYTYDGYIGNYPNVIWDEDHFEFEKLGGE